MYIITFYYNSLQNNLQLKYGKQQEFKTFYLTLYHANYRSKNYM
jgi:hypothetical protein